MNMKTRRYLFAALVVAAVSSYVIFAQPPSAPQQQQPPGPAAGPGARISALKAPTPSMPAIVSARDPGTMPRVSSWRQTLPTSTETCRGRSGATAVPCPPPAGRRVSETRYVSTA